MGKQAFIDRALADLREKGLYNTIRTIESASDAWVTIDGRRMLNMCSNNYLGFANDERLREAAKRAIDEYGVGPGAATAVLDLGDSSLPHLVTGDVRTTALSLTLGYRMLF